MAESGSDRIVPLDKLKGFKIAKGNHDVRKWEVLASDGRTVGKVNDLLIDTRAQQVRYLDVRLKKDVIDSDHTAHVLVPIGNARLQPDDKRVYVEQMDTGAFARLPEYGQEPLTREHEDFLRQRIDSAYKPGSVPEEEYYDDRMYDAERFNREAPPPSENEPPPPA
jgi:sporulation protein YlmC with PRC-barrel domain